MYRQDAIVDLTLTVSDLIDSRVGSWSVPRIRELIVEEDVERVLQTPIDLARHDQKMWGFSRNGIYNSKSGYKLAETLQEMQLPPSPGLPPIEKRLWKDLWQTNTSPKIKHFMWRALSGALAVKSRLQSRGIMLDTTCPDADCQRRQYAMSSSTVRLRRKYGQDLVFLCHLVVFLSTRCGSISII